MCYVYWVNGVIDNLEMCIVCVENNLWRDNLCVLCKIMIFFVWKLEVWVGKGFGVD